MQPYFFPYIGYFQLIAATDVFVIYDNIKYTKKGWINRNRFLRNGEDATFSLPLVSDSDTLDIRDRRLSPQFDRERLLRQLSAAYGTAPQFSVMFPEIASIIRYEADGLFDYIHHSVRRLCTLLALPTRIVVSSDVPIDHTLRAQDKVLALCADLRAGEYINTAGGMELYSREAFAEAGVSLRFIKARALEYPQGNTTFVPNLSIVDILMFNPLEQVKHWTRTAYDLL